MRSSTPFVQRRGSALCVDGQPLRLLGTNCYFLAEEGARECLGWEGYAGRVAEALEKIAGLGMNLVRAWAFNDDPENPVAMQPKAGTLSEAGCAGLDLTLELADKLGLRFILSLGNYWPDYGGLPQYLKWHGLPEDRPDLFFTAESVQVHYAEHIQALLSRINPRTGLAWGQDPCVLGWELMNEPRGTGLDVEGEEMAAWVERMAKALRAVAPQQLVLTGEEGLGEGCDLEKNTARVDMASIHLYPEEWGWPEADLAETGCQWIRKHAALSRKLNKPIFLGEFGLKGSSRSLTERRRIYARWMECALEQEGLAAAASWSFATDERPDEWDDYAWGWKTGSEASDPANRYADLHRGWAAAFRGPQLP